jgi:NAD/NADP transhydrogenase beta subunit
MTFMGSVIRFIIIFGLSEASRRYRYTTQKQLNIAAMIIFNVFSLMVFSAVTLDIKEY